MKNSSSTEPKRYIVWELGNPIPEEDETEGEDEQDDVTPLLFAEHDQAPPPFGAFSIEHSFSPNTVQFSRRNMWIGHTNFIIDKTDYEIIRNTEGIDIYRQMSPYTFIVSAGKLFADADVRTTLQKRLRASKPPKKMMDKIMPNFESV